MNQNQEQTNTNNIIHYIEEETRKNKIYKWNKYRYYIIKK